MPTRAIGLKGWMCLMRHDIAKTGVRLVQTRTTDGYVDVVCKQCNLVHSLHVNNLSLQFDDPRNQILNY